MIVRDDDLEIAGVPDAFAPFAEEVLRATRHGLRRAPPREDGLVAVGLPSSVLVVRLVEGPRGVDRLVAPEPDASPEDPPWSAIASIALEEALHWIAEGDAPAAEALLYDSLRAFPGDPSRPEAHFGGEYNRENALTYRALAFDVGLAGAADLLVAGLARSEGLQVRELGATARELVATDPTHLAELTRFLAFQLLREDPIGERLGPGIAILHSPIVYIGRQGLARGQGPWPLTFLDLFYRGAARRAVERDAAVEAIVDAIARHRDQPLELVARTFVTNALWHEVREAPLAETGRPFVAPSRLLSLMLAHVGHGAAAGLDDAELRASLGADDAPDALRSAEAKLDAFGDTLAEWLDEATP
ncbi:MAG: hypothetical protein KC619_19465 [Myxococcales bacterium]|nr:hypothetical protein [Myxococcales bacterium]